MKDFSAGSARTPVGLILLVAGLPKLFGPPEEFAAVVDNRRLRAATYTMSRSNDMAASEPQAPPPSWDAEVS